MNKYRVDLQHKQWYESIKLYPGMIDNDDARFLLFVDGMMGCYLSRGARKLCNDIIQEKYDGGIADDGG